MSKSSIIAIVCLVILYVHSAIIEPNNIQVTHFAIKDRELQGLRVAFLSDFHLKQRDYKKLNKIANLTAKQKPDVILLGGDYFKEKKIKNTMSPYLFATSMHKANVPVYGVLGESDWLVGGETIKKEFTNNGIIMLDNSKQPFFHQARHIDIIGLADKTTRGVKIAEAFRITKNSKKDTPKGKQPLRIVLSHNPDVYYDIMDDVNLILSGHTHGGQFIIPFSPPMFVPSKFGAEFASGLISKTKNKMIISKGLGTSKVPFRFNCKPEILIIDFTAN